MSMKYKIEKGVVVPPRKRGREPGGPEKWPLGELSKAKKISGELVGDCLKVEKKLKSRLMAAIQRRRKKTGERYTARVVGDQYWIWRI